MSDTTDNEPTTAGRDADTDPGGRFIEQGAGLRRIRRGEKWNPVTGEVEPVGGDE